jgi:hypothetical protein
MKAFNLKTARNFSLAVCMALLLGGCATMYAPGTDNVTIKTNPEGADVYYGAHLLGKTPLTYEFKRDTFERKTLTIRKEGYKNEEILLEKTLESKALYNFAFFLTTSGVTSWGIDAINGNMVKYTPDSYLIDLMKVGSTAGHNDHERLQRLRFVVLNQTALMKDISDGDGEYIRAYYEIRMPNTGDTTYRKFLDRIARNALLLLSSGEPLDFYRGLESIAIEDHT